MFPTKMSSDQNTGLNEQFVFQEQAVAFPPIPIEPKSPICNIADENNLTCKEMDFTPDQRVTPSKAPSTSNRKSSELVAAYNKLKLEEDEVKKLENRVKVMEAELACAKEAVEIAREKCKLSFTATKEIELGLPSQWNLMYGKLQVYKEEHGHCMVPHVNKQDKDLHKLGRWVANQRVFYKMHCKGKTGHIKPTRIEALNDLGFVWNTNEYAWEKQFQSMVEFRTKYGHNTVSKLIDKHERKKYKGLEAWIEAQQQQYRKFKHCVPANINEARIKRLNDASFDWINPNGRSLDAKEKDQKATNRIVYLPNHPPTEEEINQRWNESYQKLVEYFDQHGHCNIYTGSKNGSKGAEHQLRKFVMQQRKEYAKYIDNQQSVLTPERVDLLQRIGFSWNSGNKRGRKRKKGVVVDKDPMNSSLDIDIDIDSVKNGFELEVFDLKNDSENKNGDQRDDQMKEI